MKLGLIPCCHTLTAFETKNTYTNMATANFIENYHSLNQIYFVNNLTIAPKSLWLHPQRHCRADIKFYAIEVSNCVDDASIILCITHDAETDE